MRRWASYFRHAIAQRVFHLDNFMWPGAIRMLRERHHRRWKYVCRRFTTPNGQRLPVTAGEIELKRIAAIPIVAIATRQHELARGEIGEDEYQRLISLRGRGPGSGTLTLHTRDHVLGCGMSGPGRTTGVSSS